MRDVSDEISRTATRWSGYDIAQLRNGCIAVLHVFISN
jgi:hypothetical protein